jgi:hypothetical protein
MKTYQKHDAVVQKDLPSFDEQGLEINKREGQTYTRCPENVKFNWNVTFQA